MRTLILIDIQNDFMPGGALPVPEGDAIIPVINRIQNNFDLIVASQDWHVKNHISFASSHSNKKPFDRIMLNGKEQILWPDHCIQGTFGAQLHAELDTKPIQAIIRKATDPNIDSYSVFNDNAHQKSTGLFGYCRDKMVSEVYFCGLATDFCVYFSIKDAVKEGYHCWLIEDASRPMDEANFRNKKGELLHLGVKIIKSDSLKI
jgi:nicotinamidase/pyrazinamidase